MSTHHIRFTHKHVWCFFSPGQEGGGVLSITFFLRITHTTIHWGESGYVLTLHWHAQQKEKNLYFVFFLWNKPNYPPGEFKFKWGNKWQTSGGTWGNFSLKCCLGSLGKWAKPVPLTLIFHLQLNNSNQACRASNYFTHVEAAFMGLYCELLLSLPFRNQNTKSNIEGVAKPKKCAIRVGC